MLTAWSGLSARRLKKGALEMQEQMPAGMAKDTATFGRLPDDKKKLVEAYGLGVLHGVQITQNSEPSKPDQKKPA